MGHPLQAVKHNLSPTGPAHNQQSSNKKLDAAVHKIADKLGVPYQPLHDAVVKLHAATHPVNAHGVPQRPDANAIAIAVAEVSAALKAPAPTAPKQDAGKNGHGKTHSGDGKTHSGDGKTHSGHGETHSGDGKTHSDHGDTRPSQGGSAPPQAPSLSSGSTESDEMQAWYEYLVALGIPPDQIALILMQLAQNASPPQADGSGGGGGGGGGGNVSRVSSNSSMRQMGPATDAAGTQGSNSSGWTARSGKNDNPIFGSTFEPSMVNGKTIAIQGTHGAEVIAEKLNPSRALGTYYYSSQKTPSAGLVQSGFLFGNGRKFEVDFDELNFAKPGDTNTQMASVYIDDQKLREVTYSAADLGFKNFSDQKMQFKAEITNGHVSVQAVNSKGNWQEIAQLSNNKINADTLKNTDFKGMMSTWRLAGSPDDGRRHEMTGEMSFKPA